MLAQLVKTPVYQQLNDLLRELIRTREFKPGDRFLTERQIALRFEVSRATANKALSNLVSEGVLEFRKGLGTFVQESALDVDLGRLVSFTARAVAAGKKPETKVLAFARKKVGDLDPDIARRLALAPGESVFELRRLRLVDAIPAILERRVVVARHCPGLDAKGCAGSLYGAWTTRFKLDIMGADFAISAVTLGDEQAGLLAVKRGSAGMLLAGVGLLAGGEPLWWEHTLYRGDTFEFRNRLGIAAPSRTRPGAAMEMLTPR